MESSCRPKNEGVSLLELLITLAILAIGIVVVLESISYSTRMTALSCDVIRAVFLAEDKLQELSFKEGTGNITDIEETGADAANKFRWHYKIEKNRDYNASLNLNFNINWERSKRLEEIGVDTYLRE